MKKCKYCKSEIDAKAKICPNCKKKQGPKIGLIIFLAIVGIIAIGAIVSGNEEAKRKKDFSQNETATYKDVEYTITGISRTKGKEYFEAAEGKEYVVITLKIENKSSEKISYNALDWKMVDSNGVEDTYAVFGSDTDTDLGSGDLNANGVKTGTIAFEVPIGDKNLTLKYYETILDNEYTFKFDLND